MEKLKLSSSSTRAKLIGTIVSISGAFVVTFYKGPSINAPPSSPTSLNLALGSSGSAWIIGSLFLTVEYILVPVWYILVVTYLPPPTHATHNPWTYVFNTCMFVLKLNLIFM